MRQETETIARAWASRTPAKFARTRTDGERVWLHESVIAAWAEADTAHVTLAGWDTPTTRDRVNGVLSFLPGGVRLCRVKGETVATDRAGIIAPMGARDVLVISPDGAAAVIHR